MFLPNLQKNIQELERQISRLETECEHSVSSLGRREISPGSLESSYQPFITGPSLSTITYSPKMLNPPPQDLPGLPAAPRQAPKPPEKRSKASGEDPRGRETRSPEPVGDQKRSESKSPCKGSGQGAKEVSEFSNEGQFSRKIMSKLASKLKEVPREPTWCELLGEQTTNGGKHQPKSKKEAIKKTRSSDEESCGGGHVAVCEKPKESEEAGAPRSGRRSRSARTRKNQPQQPPEDTGPSKSLQEKETQCLLWDDKGKGEFFLNISESVKVLQGLVEELKKKPTQEKRNDVLNDMQDTLNKITEADESSSLQPLTPLDSFSKLPEGADSIANMKNALCAVKKICEELSNEKAALAEEICAKNVALANSKAKEKEYMTLISNLKYNLEKQKEMADEGVQVKRDLRILSVRLQEEAKVIEALKKSHEKMQELVENYVLENDRLKAHVKITKLETQKYNVLLAGKDAEIVKYKKEIESFQKQITEQLSLLRSRATESEVQQTIEAISTQASILQKDDDQSGPQDDDSNDTSTTTTKSQATLRVRSPSPMASAVSKWEEESKPSSWGSEGLRKGAEGGFGPMRSPRDAVRQLELENVLNSSNNLRNSINDLLEDIKREASDVYWLSAPNSCGTSARSTSNLTTSEEGSDVSPKD